LLAGPKAALKGVLVQTSGLTHSKESELGFPLDVEHARLRHAYGNIFHCFDG
jgi:hypothetical protein